MRNRLILWIALGSLFLNIGVVSAVGYVYWNSQRGEEPWQALEASSGWNDEDWVALDALLENRSVEIEGLGALIDAQAEEMLQALWREELDLGAVLENFNRVEDTRTDMSRALFVDFIEYLDTLPFQKREALLDFLLETDEFALWFL
ncbi:periplasmic heavy metal sensor [Alphaproteobacteria bacterium]|nr:periplasmic heavy metal sensor [Alphaproteobacteria bacterium]